MSYDTRELSVKITSDVDDFVKGTKKVQSQTDDSQESLEKFSSGAKKAAVALGVMGVGLTAYAKSATDYTVEQVKNAKDLSRQTGMTVEDASRLEYAAQRLGIGADQASTAFGIFSKQIQKTTEATDPAKTKLGELGISVKDSAGIVKPFNNLLLETADKFRGMKDGSEKTAAAMELFGRSGKDLIPLLNQGSDGIKKLEEQADKLGITLTSKNIQAVNKYIQSQKDLADSTNALKIQVGTLTAPILAQFNQKINEAVSGLLKIDGPIHNATVGMLAFGGPVVTGTAALTGFAANLATIGKSTLLLAARLGGIGTALTAAAAAFAYLNYSVYETAEKTGSASTALQSWQGHAVSAVPGIGLLASSAAALSGQFMSNKFQSDELARAHDNLTRSQNEAKVATDQLRDANLMKQGADLAVEQAQLNYNQAVAQYGPNSIQARQASYDLEVAQSNQKNATDRAKDALDAKSRKDSEVSKNKDLERHLGDQAGAADGSRGAIDRVIDSLHNFNAVQIAKKVLTIGVDIDKSVLHSLHIPGFASGVDNFSGGLAVVGENGPELVNLPKGSSVTPADQTKKYMKSGAPSPLSDAGSGNNTTVNLTVNVGMYAGMPVEKRQIALELYRELVRAGRAQGVQLEMIGAVTPQ